MISNRMKSVDKVMGCLSVISEFGIFQYLVLQLMFFYINNSEIKVKDTIKLLWYGQCAPT